MKTRFLIIALIFFVSSCTHHEEGQNNRNENLNFVVIMADDMGFSDLSSYGSEIPTPNIDSIGMRGIRFLRFYNNAKCYPSRASLLTGAYPHRAGLGRHILHLGKEKTTGPYQGYLSNQVSTIAELLRESDYKSYLSGKWHVGENPEDWPLKRGFDRYFGLVSGASSYFELLGGQKRTRQMVLEDELWTPPDSGFYLTTAITDYAIDRIKNHRENTPFFLYVAYTAPHWPLHALQQDIEKFEGYYDSGWHHVRDRRYHRQRQIPGLNGSTTLPSPPASVPMWKDIEDKETWARRMEVYAAMVHRMDVGVGKIIESLRQTGHKDNTMIIFVSDNGASPENIESRGLNDESVPIGLRGSYAAYREPWAYVSNTPLRRYKSELNEGGISTPFLMEWPGNVQSGSINHVFAGHLLDLVPTILGVTDNRSHEFDGLDLLSAIENKNDIRPQPLFWEYLDQKAVIDGWWKALYDPNSQQWSLYNLKEDRTELKDLKSEFPEILDSLKHKHQKWSRDLGIEKSDI